jgi:cytochrome c-type biogenesis protein CcmE
MTKKTRQRLVQVFAILAIIGMLAGSVISALVSF